MKNQITSLALALCLSAGAMAQTSVTAMPGEPASSKYASIKHEIARAIERGNEYLKSKQQDGIWSTKAFPAMTALPLTAYMRSPEREQNLPEYIQKGYQFVLESQKENGSIYNRGLASYNTSVCMMALLAANREDYTPALLKARAFLIRQQDHFAPDSPYHGGIGYGDENSPPIADLSNTSMALEAIYHSQKLAQDGKYGEQPELDWNAAADFVSRLQQTSDDKPEDKGGFIYRPTQANETPQGAMKKPEGLPPSAEQGQRQGRRGGGWQGGREEQGSEPRGAYGSMTYAGIQSLIYAKLTKDDPRVQMALEWLARNYTLEENPGVGLQGLYYYYQAMSKAMTATGMDTLKLADGRTIDWRDDLAKKLITTQQSDGSWVNTNNRWWESDPILVTSYCILALEQIYHSIPEPK